jgi:hypothetical protein
MTLGMLAIIISVSSCKKEATCNRGDTVTLLGKWSIISDSSFLNVGINNHPVNYKGQKGDYFDFRTDNKLYINEGGMLDTLHYNLTSDTTLVIDAFGIILNGIPETSSITHLTAHSVIITAPVVITPGGVFGRRVDLSR